MILSYVIFPLQTTFKSYLWVHSVQALASKICCEADIENPAASSSSFLHKDFDTLWLKKLTDLCSEVSVEGK